MPDLAVNRVTVEPETSDPNREVTIRTRIANVGTGKAMPARLVIRANGVEVGRSEIQALQPGSELERTIRWLAKTPGRSVIAARLEIATDAFDANAGNNVASTIVRISGEERPFPEVEFSANLDGMAQPGRGRRALAVKIRNPSFAPIREVPIKFFLDGKPLRLTENIRPLLTIKPGGEQIFPALLPDLTPGQHVISVKLDPPPLFPDRWFQRVKSWPVYMPDNTKLYDTLEKGKWVSIGPRLLTTGQPDDSVGRIDAISFHPKDQNILYAGAPEGGIWKSTNRGDSWTPVGDKLNSLRAKSIALDPLDGNIVYLGTGSSVYQGGVGIFKSIDGGQTWDPFTDKAVTPEGTLLSIQGVSRLVVHRTAAGSVLIYAATDVGVLRYESDKPAAKVSKPSDWVRSKSGMITDIAVHPTNTSVIYASIRNDGIYKTDSGQMAGESNWSKLITPVTINTSTGQWFTIDVFWGSPQILYAALTSPRLDREFGLYRTMNDGGYWDSVEYKAKELSGPYNPFVRISPQNKDIVYFGGVKLYKKQWGKTGETLIQGIHDDMHGLEFDPFSLDQYYVVGDGGIFRCKIASSISTSDSAVHRNYDLRVTQFFDLDAASGNANLMLGGTQDNGTLIYEGNPDWRLVKDGDGLYSVIAPKNNQVMYAQYQSLDSTARSGDGGKSWAPVINNGLPKGFVMENSFITVHPNDAKGDTVLSQGDQVYVTQNGGKSWMPKGPKGSNVKGSITRVVVQPKTFDWVAGNDQGQIWCTPYGGSPWEILFEHPENAPVRSMAFAPPDYRVLYVIFGGGQDYMRLWRFVLNPGPPSSWSPSNITDNFPSERIPMVISGDGHDTGIAYVGTDKGIYRWQDGKPTYESWQLYDDGFPLVKVNDLLVDPTSKQLRAATFGRGAWTVVTGP
jgi:photosystem II stability/assembly factor-like uncharacterized protein